MKNVLVLFFLISSFSGYGFQINQDSINEDYSERIDKVEGYQKITNGAIDNKFTALSLNLDKKYKLLEWLGYIGIPLNLLFILGLLWSRSKYVNKKVHENIEKIVIENKQAIKKVVEKQQNENQFVKNKQILVLTADKGNTVFLRKFFKKMKFPDGNIVYETTKSMVAANQNSYVAKFDMIFANNENDDLSFDIIHSYFKNSNPKAVLFYFGTNRFTAETPEIGNRLSMASFKTQIYGNLINLFRYQELI